MMVKDALTMISLVRHEDRSRRDTKCTKSGTMKVGWRAVR